MARLHNEQVIKQDDLETKLINLRTHYHFIMDKKRNVEQQAENKKAKEYFNKQMAEECKQIWANDDKIKNPNNPSTWQGRIYTATLPEALWGSVLSIWNGLR